MKYDSERIQVREQPGNASKVVISDKFSGNALNLNKEAFIAMVKELNERDKDNKNSKEAGA